MKKFGHIMSLEIENNDCLALCDITAIDQSNYGKIFTPFFYKSLREKDDISILEDDRNPSIFLKQYEYVGEIYNLTLKILVENLNSHHQISFSSRQWELIIGPWLRIYLESLYCRWDMLDLFIERGIRNIALCYRNDEVFSTIADNRNEYTTSKILDETWNHITFSKIALYRLSNLENINIKKFEISAPKNTPLFSKTPLEVFIHNFIKLPRVVVQILLEKLSFIISKKNAIVINNPYLGLFNKILLAFSLKKNPVFYFNKILKVQKSVTAFNRSINFKYSQAKDEFHRFCLDNLINEIPSCYLENFSDLLKSTDDLSLPDAPDIIFTGSGVEADEIIRIYIAKNINKGSEYIISQHGGVYGTRLIPTKSEFYEHRVCDKWISWGWTDSKNSKIKRGLNIKEIGRKKTDFFKGKKILYALPNITFISSRLMPLHPLKRIKQNKIIIQGLKEDILKDLLIRSHPNHIHEEYVKDIASGCTISSEKDFWTDLSNSKLFITTNNSTTFLQSMVANCPSILILLDWQKDIRDISQDIYNQLECVNIVFRDMQSAIRHINNVAKEPQEWWVSNEVQKVRKQFCELHSRKSYKPIDTLSKLFF